MMTTSPDSVEAIVQVTGLHATLTWEPYIYQPGDGTKQQGYRRSDGQGYVLPSNDDYWWVSWAHPMLCGGPGWHHHALGSYSSATAGAMAFDEVYDLERFSGNKDRCPDDFASQAQTIAALRSALAELGGGSLPPACTRCNDTGTLDRTSRVPFPCIYCNTTHDAALSQENE